jgi:FkbM family methyltransferase
MQLKSIKMEVNNFTVIESIYGRIIVDRHCDYQIDALAKTGRTHIESELKNIFNVLDHVPDGSIIIDGGTNIGLFSIPVAQKVKHRNIKVVGFEPQRILAYALGGTIALNDLENCWIHNLALSDKPRTVTLPEVNYSKVSDYGTIKVSDIIANIEESKYLGNRLVDAVTIDSLELPNIKFIKLDIEGYEIPAINGAINTIRKEKPFLWIEYFLIGLDKIVETINKIAPYKIYVMDPQNILCVPD